MEESNATLKTERDALEQQVAEIKEAQVSEQFEIVRLKTSLEQEKKKVEDVSLTLSMSHMSR